MSHGCRTRHHAKDQEVAALGNADGWVQVGLAVVAIGLTLWLVRRERRTKRLAYAILSNRPLITGHGRFPLEVRFGNAALRRLHLLVWRLVNTGAQPIQTAEYEEPIRVHISDAKIVSADVTLTRPEALHPKLDLIDPGTVELERRLLNQGDLVEVQMLVDGKPDRITASCRIAGITKIEMVKLPQNSWGRPWRYSPVERAAAVITLVLLGGLGVLAGVTGDEPAKRIVGWLILGGAVLSYPTLVWRSTRKNRLFLGS
jgi:hypothetical protein